MVFGPSLVSDTGFLLGFFLVSEPGPTFGLQMVCSETTWVKGNIPDFLNYPLIAMLALTFVGSGEIFAPPPFGPCTAITLCKYHKAL